MRSSSLSPRSCSAVDKRRSAKRFLEATRGVCGNDLNTNVLVHEGMQSITGDPISMLFAIYGPLNSPIDSASRSGARLDSRLPCMTIF